MKKQTWRHARSFLFETGSQLEEVFAACLKSLGGEVGQAKYSQEEFILTVSGERLLVECKGVTKGIALTHVRQLFDYMTKYEEDEGVAGKGILFGNAWRDLPPSNRNGADSQVFPPNVIERAEQLGVALVSSVDFFDAYCRFLDGSQTGAAILQQLIDKAGIVNFK